MQYEELDVEIKEYGIKTLTLPYTSVHLKDLGREHGSQIALDILVEFPDFKKDSKKHFIEYCLSQFNREEPLRAEIKRDYGDFLNDEKDMIQMFEELEDILEPVEEGLAIGAGEIWSVQFDRENAPSLPLHILNKIDKASQSGNVRYY